MTDTNNRLESINQKLKAVVKTLLRHASVFQGFEGLHIINEGGPSSLGSQNSGKTGEPVSRLRASLLHGEY